MLHIDNKKVGYFFIIEYILNLNLLSTATDFI